MIVAIDGYSSCGKSTIAKQLAKSAGYTYVDTGAMYRSVALLCMRKNWLTEEGVNEQALQAALPDLKLSFSLQPDGSQHILLNGEDVEAEIRTMAVSNNASRVSTLRFVREEMVRQQRLMGENGNLVMDGRDIGTVVFPNAELKLFLTASPEIRAERRYKELIEKGQEANYEDVLRDTQDRDYRDTHRAESPLKQADDAVVVDNSHLTRDEQMNEIMRIFNQRKNA